MTQTSTATETPAGAYTDAQATDEAVLLLVRKLHRLYPHLHADLMSRLPGGARDALMLADQRADLLRTADRAAGTTRAYPNPWAVEEDDDEDV